MRTAIFRSLRAGSRDRVFTFQMRYTKLTGSGLMCSYGIRCKLRNIGKSVLVFHIMAIIVLYNRKTHTLIIGKYV